MLDFKILSRKAAKPRREEDKDILLCVIAALRDNDLATEKLMDALCLPQIARIEAGFCCAIFGLKLIHELRDGLDFFDRANALA